MRRQIVPHQLAHRLPRLKGSAGMVGLHQHIRKRQKARVQLRLALKDIQRGRPKPARLQRIQKRRLIDIGRPADICLLYTSPSPRD